MYKLKFGFTFVTCAREHKKEESTRKIPLGRSYGDSEEEELKTARRSCQNFYFKESKI